MKSHLVTMVGVVLAGSILACCGCKSDNQETGKPGMKSVASKPAMTQNVYVCPDCHTMAMRAGKCSMCGKDLMSKHMLGMQDGKVMVCDCHAGCTCNMAGMKDGKCACGKVVQEMSPKGMYACACAVGKCCGMIADKPGKCACGTDMKKVE